MPQTRLVWLTRSSVSQTERVWPTPAELIGEILGGSVTTTTAWRVNVYPKICATRNNKNFQATMIPGNVHNTLLRVGGTGSAAQIQVRRICCQMRRTRSATRINYAELSFSLPWVSFVSLLGATREFISDFFNQAHLYDNNSITIGCMWMKLGSRCTECGNFLYQNFGVLRGTWHRGACYLNPYCLS